MTDALLSTIGWWFIWMAWAAMFAAYMAGTIVAAARNHRQVAAIGALNLLLGWTVLGWIGALVWSLTKDPS